MNKITVERTGRIYSFASVEFIATFPNGDRAAIWSPPWAYETDTEGNQFDLDYESPKQDEGALAFANEIWENKNYQPIGQEYIDELEKWRTYANV